MVNFIEKFELLKINLTPLCYPLETNVIKYYSCTKNHKRKKILKEKIEPIFKQIIKNVINVYNFKTNEKLEFSCLTLLNFRLNDDVLPKKMFSYVREIVECFYMQETSRFTQT
jgi:hypothetical protein